MDALASLSALALAAESPSLRLSIAQQLTGHEWLGSSQLTLSFWRHGKALRHQPGRANPSADKIASRLYKLPRPLFDCRNSGRDVKHEENQGVPFLSRFQL